MADEIRIQTGHKDTPLRQRDGIIRDHPTVSSAADKEQQEDAAFWKTKFIHLAADLENTKKRLKRNAAREVDSAVETLLRDLLPVADGLDLALLHSAQEEEDKGIRQGIELVGDMINQFFISHEVMVIDSWGKPFDPSLHEAVGVVNHPESPANTVVRVEQKGYMYRDRLLRPAQVLVTPR